MHQHKICWLVFLKAGKYGLTVEIDMNEKVQKEKEMVEKNYGKTRKECIRHESKKMHTHSYRLFHTNYKESAFSTGQEYLSISGEARYTHNS